MAADLDPRPHPAAHQPSNHRRRRPRFDAGVVGLLVLCLALVWPSFGNDSTTGAASRWPSWPIPWTPSPTPLDEETLQRLVIFAFAPGEAPVEVPVGSLGDALQVLPGGSLALTLGAYECCYVFHPVPARAVWSISPTDGVEIDPATGLLAVDPATPSGSVFTVRANVENGRRIVTTKLHVFTPEANPLVGFWHESAQIDCATGGEIVPAEPIRELVFGADGAFGVTWFPFEVYKDYWGTYTFDPAAGTLDLVVAGGNYVPPDVDGHGQFKVDTAGRLVLTDLWLGTPHAGTGPPHCGHIFAP